MSNDESRILFFWLFLLLWTSFYINMGMNGWFMKFLMVPHYRTLSKHNISSRKVLQKQRVRDNQTNSCEPIYGQPSSSIPPGSWHDLSGTKNVFWGFGFLSQAFLYLIYQRLYFFNMISLQRHLVNSSIPIHTFK
jgi:hypothetical protein